MSVDHIRYDILAQEALRSVLRRVLSDAAKKGLPGDHHFYITLDTNAPGVRMSARLHAQYPEGITIVLQHQFWDLVVGDELFEIGLSFGGVPEHLVVPFAAIRRFFDPSVQFGLQFEIAAAAEEQPKTKAGAVARDVPAKPASDAPAAPAPPPAAAPSKKAKKPAEAAAPEKTDKPAGGGEVVRLDRFRKK